MILFVSATIREMEHFIKGWLPLSVLNYPGSNVKFRDTDIGFLICGIGPLNAAISLERYLENNRHTLCVINIGIAGSYDLGLFPLGSVCVASREIWPEYGVRTQNCLADPEKIGFPLYRKGNDVIWNSLQLETEFLSHVTGLTFDLSWRRGVSITLAGISSCPDQAREFKEYFQGNMENMEGFALAYCCYLRSIPFVEVRSISNLAGSRNKEDWDFKGAFVALQEIWSGFWGIQHS